MFDDPNDVPDQLVDQRRKPLLPAAVRLIVIAVSCLGACYIGCWVCIPVALVSVVGMPGPGPQDYYFRIHSGYKFWRTSAHVHLINSHDDKLCVESDVVMLGWDSRFIGCRRALTNGFGHPTSSQPQADEFYIIDAAHRRRFGPLSEKEYLDKWKSLGVKSPLVLHPYECYGRDGVLNCQPLPHWPQTVSQTAKKAPA